MRIKSKIIFLLPILFLSVSLKTATAQTSAGAGNKTDAVHTLSESQKQAIKLIQVETEKRAAPAALKLAGIVSAIYDNMLADKPDEELRARLSAEMKESAWALLSIKGQSIRDIVNVLTREQKQLVKSEMLKPGASADLSEVIKHTFKLDDK
ncbi:MAG: hypothetical protein QOE46_378 [Acidobacteriota bacterium]|jgi:Spy/CpxP family protein refolding chaperone|nr:hypothetical protein [Acidobacteriota bacterium]